MDVETKQYIIDIKDKFMLGEGARIHYLHEWLDKSIFEDNIYL